MRVRRMQHPRQAATKRHEQRPATLDPITMPRTLPSLMLAPIGPGSICCLPGAKARVPFRVTAAEGPQTTVVLASGCLGGAV